MIDLPGRPRAASRLAIYGALILATLFFALPAWFALINSLKPLQEIQAGNVLGLPARWTVEPWIAAWSTACTGAPACAGLARYFVHSLMVAIPATVISTLWGCFNGYLLAKWRFRGSDAVLFVLMFGSFVPGVLFVFPLSIIFARLQLAHSLVGLVVVHTLYSLPIALFFRNYFVGFPGDLIKAARIDGAGLWVIFRRIVLPTAKPILVVVAIMQFTSIWNDFQFALVLAPSDQQLVTVGLNNLTNVQEDVAHHNTYMAAALIAGLPPLLIYIAAGKYFVRGLVSGAVKG
ncbi:carbohydrate ABC transporter permease [Verminephrobacter aporrectodeae subsp. tuberculatae]|uniref:carbohydrate ABC transporter permease n=1 Tax=Verminephrobacter aporrectodeae TaxID=1110389 RepID=UPI002237E595|nr:carbohydrate ABC transporter permease [Verminephrobacter aporrectodeae]MCW5222234.1 carbohydrate ABC transporter permease [Verminephrobacter aporrectodeae subsp. tuberculatae]MCW5287698.1 carbohydrate ABC transporter permease [Verminephrobacter aporrectodeae subsp. tuberculatae]MCW8199792.1 carbohydrate ABC transporter permease [Verminephrobacter aporrectodeae subsp. tuberculatae]